MRRWLVREWNMRQRFNPATPIAAAAMERGLDSNAPLES
jgi:hypothetical protein